MILDMEFFGYGVGLVMVGWSCGMAVAFAFSLLRRGGGR